jgi:hypothetical protein
MCMCRVDVDVHVPTCTHRGTGRAHVRPWLCPLQRVRCITHACVVHGVVVVVSTQQAPLLFRRDPKHLIALQLLSAGSRCRPLTSHVNTSTGNICTNRGLVWDWEGTAREVCVGTDQSRTRTWEVTTIVVVAWSMRPCPHAPGKGLVVRLSDKGRTGPGRELTLS